MRYMGSKARIAKEILGIILANRVNNDMLFIEPFAGGFNLTAEVSGNRLAQDINPYVISLISFLYKHKDQPNLLQDYFPDVVTEQDYKDCQNSYKTGCVNPYIAFVLFGCSFGGKFNAGYARDKTGKRNYASESKRNLMKQATKLGSNLSIKEGSYTTIDLDIPKAIIYCDPPYQNTTKYKVSEFDYVNFYDWCRLAKSKGHEVFLSEYQAPTDFTEVWSKQVNCSLTNQDRTSAKISRVEKLFKL
jgi:DNA adenine methylase